MKIINKIAIILFSACFVLTSCEDMLEVDTNRNVDPEGYEFNTPDDNVYALSGIQAQLQKLSDRYVILGGLRGDLMDITPNANSYLQQIYNFKVTADNPYASLKEYYAIINNCNYVISHIDTTVWYEGEPVMKQGYAAAKGYRAWVYMQIALNYGTAKWFDKPLLNLEDLDQDFPTYNITQLADVLIPDLLPSKAVENTSNYVDDLFPPIRYLLGELYMWKKDYDNAANEYRDLLYYNKIDFTTHYNWVVNNGEFTQTISIYNKDVNSRVFTIFTSNVFGESSNIGQYAMHTSVGGLYWIKPSQVAINNWDSELYYHDDDMSRINGDLRGLMYHYGSVGVSVFTDWGKSVKGHDNYITEFSQTERYISTSTAQYQRFFLVTKPMAYLRYAEAVNRLGKPNLAFAVLKHGLNNATIISYVPSNEKTPLPAYMNFNDIRFAENIGIHAHGCGYTETAEDYMIPPLTSIEDSIAYVEDLIVKELALETPFDGNRFHDLMRVSIRRNDPSYLANKVAEKYTDKEGMHQILTDMKNWYLPTK